MPMKPPGKPIFITRRMSGSTECQGRNTPVKSCRQTEIDINEIKHVYLAGGFGNFMRIRSALRIGLLPEELSGRISAVGNAAGSGAIRAMLSIDEYSVACETAKRIKYVELSADPLFADCYTDNMFFD